MGQDRNVPWFNERPSGQQISPAARQLLETYNHVPSEQIDDHVIKVRNEAWEIFPYPCIGQFRFLDLSLSEFKEYAGILDRLHEGQKLLDMACCFGQEIRKLVADGAPSKHIYGCDLRPEYITLSYKLFADRDSLRANFLTADIFDKSSALTDLGGQFDIIYTGSFFHLWGYDDQVRVSKAVAALLRPRKGSIIIGRQVGSEHAREHDHVTNPTGTMFRHNVESFQKM